MSLFATNINYIGVDIGTTSIKAVQLIKEAGKIKLVSYGFSENVKSGLNDWQNDAVYAAKVINDIRNNSGMNCNNAVSALPTFSVFSSVLNLSNVTKKDMSSAIHWEAKKVIPLPLEEMILDWKKIDNASTDKKTIDGNMRVLLTGAPRTLVRKYIDIFKETRMTLMSLETETFSLIRSLLGNDKSTVMIVELGASTTDVSIIDNGIPMLNRSIDVGGLSITNAISKLLDIGIDRAEQFKYDLGISSLDSTDDQAPKIIIDTIAPIVNEIKYAINLFQTKNNKNTEKIILTGGSALMPNMPNYLAKILDMKVIVGDPWARISYPVDLKPLLNEIGPRMAVAVGLAMREIE